MIIGITYTSRKLHAGWKALAAAEVSVPAYWLAWVRRYSGRTLRRYHTRAPWFCIRKSQFCLFSGPSQCTQPPSTQRTQVPHRTPGLLTFRCRHMPPLLRRRTRDSSYTGPELALLNSPLIRPDTLSYRNGQDTRSHIFWWLVLRLKTMLRVYLGRLLSEPWLKY